LLFLIDIIPISSNYFWFIAFIYSIISYQRY